MRIAIPVKKQNSNYIVNDTFGRSEYLYIYDLNLDKKMIVKNDAITSPGGAGIKASQQIINLNIDVLIVDKLGKNAAEVLKNANIDLLQPYSEDISENIDMYRNNKLNKLSKIHSGYHR